MKRRTRSVEVAMRVLIDTNVILDEALSRQPWQPTARAAMSECHRQHDAMIAFHTLPTLFYLIRRHSQSAVVAKRFCQQLVSWARVAPADHTVALRAFQLPLSDFEDAMQASVAEASGAAIILSRNTKDFTASPVPAMTPEDFLLTYHPASLP
ncbi:MAG: PIN domain-containing protein [Verrucomicrobiales bacterium]|nr:PIN domain-containing protein [Verrucomicrobiales bacterium]MCP5558781.1 PIN domain-containing protein [Verrucomicrobiaceae bacterium]